MEEDDTARILRRPNFDEITRSGGIFNGYIWKPFSSAEIQTLERYGWTELEFKKAWKARTVDIKPEGTYFWEYEFEKEIERLENLNERRRHL